MSVAEALARGTQKLGVRIALEGGRQGKKSSFVAAWEPYCDQPVRLERRTTSRQATKGLKMGKLKLVDPLKALEVAALVPCRKCPRCLQFRQMRWRQRAIAEIAAANRTWLITLTFSPHHLAGILIEAKSSEKKAIERAAYRHVQKFFKRMRKGGRPGKTRAAQPRFKPAEFRYLAVFELGEKHDRMHYHLLLHEIGTRPIFKESIQSQWRSFSNCRLVMADEAGRNASYVTKYATKSIDIRPRASAHYGNTQPLPKRPVLGELITNNKRGKDDDAPTN